MQPTKTVRRKDIQNLPVKTQWFSICLSFGFHCPPLREHKCTPTNIPISVMTTILEKTIAAPRLKTIITPRLRTMIEKVLDIEKEIQITDDAWIFDGIKLPHVVIDADGAWEYGLSDIVYPSYFKHNVEGFDDYYACIGNIFGDFSEGPYEYGNICLNEGDVVFDCGANMGLFSAVASRYGAEVFAFEAIPDFIDNYLSKTASMNDNIRIFNVAVWDKEEALNFSLIPDNIGASRADQLLGEDPNHIQGRKRFVVPAITLDAFVEKNGIRHVDFIKADIEGAERNMLRGAKRVLKEFAPKLSICTYHRHDDPQVLREIILEANPEYQIIEKFKKMYACVP